MNRPVLAAAILLVAAPALAVAAPAHHHRHAAHQPAGIQKHQPATQFMAARPFSMPSDPDRTRAVRIAWLAHEAGAKPAGWTKAVAAIRAEADPVRKLTLADGFINHGIRYVDRHGGPWTLTPAGAFAHGGLCRDVAAAKAFLLLDAGFPASDIRLITLLPNLNHLPYHVVVAARVAAKPFLLDMTKVAQARAPHGYAIPADALDITESTSRIPVAVVSASAWAIPLQTAALPEKTGGTP